jgi:hypothetical protein
LPVLGQSLAAPHLLLITPACGRVCAGVDAHVEEFAQRHAKPGGGRYARAVAQMGGRPHHWGPLLVLVLSGLGVAVWRYTQGEFGRADVFSIRATLHAQTRNCQTNAIPQVRTV